MERNPIIESQILFKEEENKLWEGIEEYKRPSIKSIHPITGIVEANDNEMLLYGLQVKKPLPRMFWDIDERYFMERISPPETKYERRKRYRETYGSKTRY